MNMYMYMYMYMYIKLQNTKINVKHYFSRFDTTF